MHQLPPQTGHLRGQLGDLLFLQKAVANVRGSNWATLGISGTARVPDCCFQSEDKFSNQRLETPWVFSPVSLRFRPQMNCSSRRCLQNDCECVQVWWVTELHHSGRMHTVHLQQKRLPQTVPRRTTDSSNTKNNNIILPRVWLVRHPFWFVRRTPANHPETHWRPPFCSESHCALAANRIASKRPQEDSAFLKNKQTALEL